MNDHTLKAYDKELESLERRIAEMGGIAEKMVIDAMDALIHSDSLLAHAVIASDDRLDALQREIEESAVLTIARRQPMAVDLREIVGAIRVAGDLERVGDLAKNIAKRSLKIGGEARSPAGERRPQAHEQCRAGIAQGRARRLRPARHRAGAGGVGARRGARRARGQRVPRSA